MWFLDLLCICATFMHLCDNNHVINDTTLVTFIGLCDNIGDFCHIYVAENHVVLVLFNMLTQMMLQKPNIRWMAKFFLVGS